MAEDELVLNPYMVRTPCPGLVTVSGPRLAGKTRFVLSVASRFPRSRVLCEQGMRHAEDLDGALYRLTSIWSLMPADVPRPSGKNRLVLIDPGNLYGFNDLELIDLAMRLGVVIVVTRRSARPSRLADVELRLSRGWWSVIRSRYGGDRAGRV